MHQVEAIVFPAFSLTVSIFAQASSFVVVFKTFHLCNMPVPCGVPYGDCIPTKANWCMVSNYHQRIQCRWQIPWSMGFILSPRCLRSWCIALSVCSARHVQNGLICRCMSRNHRPSAVSQHPRVLLPVLSRQVVSALCRVFSKSCNIGQWLALFGRILETPRYVPFSFVGLVLYVGPERAQGLLEGQNCMVQRITRLGQGARIWE